MLSNNTQPNVMGSLGPDVPRTPVAKCFYSDPRTEQGHRLQNWTFNQRTRKRRLKLMTTRVFSPVPTGPAIVLSVCVLRSWWPRRNCPKDMWFQYWGAKKIGDEVLFFMMLYFDCVANWTCCEIVGGELMAPWKTDFFWARCSKLKAKCHERVCVCVCVCQETLVVKLCSTRARTPNTK